MMAAAKRYTTEQIVEKLREVEKVAGSGIVLEQPLRAKVQRVPIHRRMIDRLSQEGHAQDVAASRIPWRYSTAN
jgi:hypothetical protein